MSLPARAPRSRARGGFTLFEVIVAIVLLVALVSLSMPVVSSRLDAAALDAALERSATHVLLARAYAQATGEPVEILHDASRRAWIARRFVMEAASLGAGGDGIEAALGPAFGSGDELDPDDERIIPEAWAMEVLPRRVRITFEQPEAMDGRDDGAGAGAATLDDAWLEDDDPLYALPEDDWDDLGPRAPERFAVILPDGTALLARPAWVVGNDGRAARIDVHPWSSTLMIGAVEAPEPEATDEESEDEPRASSPKEPRSDGGAARPGAARPGAAAPDAPVGPEGEPDA